MPSDQGRVVPPGHRDEGDGRAERERREAGDPVELLEASERADLLVSSDRVVDPIGPNATQARLRTYAAAAGTISEVQGVLMAMDLVLVDRRTLSREGRAKTSVGAERFYDALLRRLCASRTTSTEWADARIEVLSAARDGRLGADVASKGQAAARALTDAMIDAALSIEGEGWPKASSLH